VLVNPQGEFGIAQKDKGVGVGPTLLNFSYTT